MGCYSFGDPDRTVSLDILEGPGPVGPTGDGSQERMLGGGGLFAYRKSWLVPIAVPSSN